MPFSSIFIFCILAVNCLAILLLSSGNAPKILLSGGGRLIACGLWIAFNLAGFYLYTRLRSK